MYFNFVKLLVRQQSQYVSTSVQLTFTCSVRQHDRFVLALGARQAVLGLGTCQAVARTRAAIAFVEHVL